MFYSRPGASRSDNICDADLDCSSSYSFEVYALRTGVEQVSIPTAVEYG